MIKDYHVNIPPTLAEVLADIGGKDPGADFDEIVNAAFSSFFSFYTPKRISGTLAADLEKFILNYFIMRRVGSGNVRKWRQMFRNRWSAIIPYYERLLETEENEKSYFADPMLNVDIHRGEVGSGTRDTDTDRKRTGTANGTHTTDETATKTHSGNFSENSSSNEVNRFSDTPQGDSSDIWETDGHGHVSLTDIYLTDIRGITDSGNRTGTDGSTDTTVTDRDEATTDRTTEDETIKVDEDTTHKTDNDDLGYTGSSPSKLMEEYRETFLRLYEDIARELEPCFYNLVEVEDLIDFV